MVSLLHWKALRVFVVSGAATALVPNAFGVTTIFFNSSQSTNMVSSGTTSDTIGSEVYLFTMTRDKLFTGGTGTIIGRDLRVHWPEGLEAQAVTAGPVTGKATILVSRQDGEPFSITSFTGKLLANTYGAGGSFEIMPMLNGEDAFNDPYPYNASGSANQSFTHSTPELTNYHAYKIALYVDFALTALTVVDASLPPPQLEIFQANNTTVEILWPASATGYNLESASSVSGNPWNFVTNAITLIGGFKSVQIDVAGEKKFFRLKK